MGDRYHPCQTQRRYGYPMAIFDLFSRKFLTWRFSNTIDTEFSVSDLEEAMTVYR
jgi:hypothetical protein